MKLHTVSAVAAVLSAFFVNQPVVGTVFSPEQPATGWRTLFDGKNLDAWRGYKTGKVPAGWRIAEGRLTKDGRVDDIVSKEEYDHIYWSAPEYQLLDDVKGEDNKTRFTCAGAAYALFPSPAGHLKPVGQWNTARIIANGAHVEHWLNGVKLVEYELWSPIWEAMVHASKFTPYPNYGRAKKGHIAMQGDHNGALAFRNIRIRELK